MARDITFGIRLRADGSGFVGEVKLAGDEVRRFGRQTKDAAREVEGASKEMESSLRRAATVGTLLGNVIADVARDVLGAVPRMIDALDALDEQAQGLGTTAVALAELRIGARLAGVNAGQFDQALTRLNQRLVDAANGGRESAAIFRAMGIEVKDASGNVRAGDQVLGEIAEKFGGYRDGAEKATLATELFGRSAGPRMVAWLNQGSEALRANSGVTEELVAQAKAAQEQIDRLGVEFERLSNGLLARALPTINALLGEVNDAATAFGGLGRAILNVNPLTIRSDYGNGIQELTLKLESLRRSEAAVLQQVGGAVGDAAQRALSTIRADIDVAERLRRYYQARQRSEALAGAGGVLDARDARARMDGLAAAPRIPDEPPRQREDRDDFARLTGQLRERIALMAAEEEAGRSLTNAEQFRVKVLDDLAAGELRLKTGSAEALRAELDRLVVVERGTLARRAAAEAVKKADEEARRDEQRAAQEMARAVEAAANYGKLRSEIEALEVARLQSALAQQVMAGESEREIDYTRRLIDLKRRQAQATKDAEEKQASDQIRRRTDDIETETAAVLLNSAQRERAIMLRELEAAGIQRGSQAWTENAARIERATRKLEDLETARRIAGAIDEAAAAGARFGESLVMNFSNAGDAVRQLEQDLLRLGTRLLVTEPIEKWLRGALSTEVAGGAGSSGMWDWIGNAFIAAFGMHDGGIAGRDASFTRKVPAAMFRGAPRLHSGGLLPGEVPAILQRGEEVITRRDPRHRENAGGAPARPIAVTLNVNTGGQAVSRQTVNQITAGFARALATADARMN